MVLLVQAGGNAAFRAALERYGLEVVSVNSASEALDQVAQRVPDLAILEVPNAEKLCRALRGMGSNLVVVISSDHSDECQSAAHAMLSACADTYLPGSVSADELLSCVKTLLPRHLLPELICGDLVLHLYSRTLYKRGMPIRLNPKLTRLLQVLMERAGEVVLRRELMQQVWNTDYTGDTRTLDVHIRWLRRAIEDDPARPTYIQTVRGRGYRLVIPRESVP